MTKTGLGSRYPTQATKTKDVARVGRPSVDPQTRRHAEVGMTGLISMPEMADAGEYHGYAETVCGGDYVLILHRAAGLDDCCRASRGDSLETVREGKEGVGSAHRALERQDRLHGAEAGGIHSAHLAGADADSLPVAGVHDGVRLDVLADSPGEDQAAQFLRGWRAPGDHVQLRLFTPAGVGLLEP